MSTILVHTLCSITTNCLSGLHYERVESLKRLWWQCYFSITVTFILSLMTMSFLYYRHLHPVLFTIISAAVSLKYSLYANITNISYWLNRLMSLKQRYTMYPLEMQHNPLRQKTWLKLNTPTGETARWCRKSEMNSCISKRDWHRSISKRWWRRQSFSTFCYLIFYHSIIKL